MKVLIGLGNPQEKFFNNRHNIGWMFLDSLAENPWKEGFNSLYQEVDFNNEHIILVKPTTFMNTSGIAAKEVCDYFNIHPENVMIAYDDLDLPFGFLRIKKSKTSGGHNGVKSIMEQLQYQKFIRIKFGIGRPPEGMSAYDYVLSDFSQEELEKIPLMLEQAGQIRSNLDYEFMTRLNGNCIKKEQP